MLLHCAGPQLELDRSTAKNGASGTDRRMNFALIRQANLRLSIIIPRLELKERISGFELLVGMSVECHGLINSRDGYFAKKKYLQVQRCSKVKCTPAHQYILVPAASLREHKWYILHTFFWSVNENSFTSTPSIRPRGEMRLHLNIVSIERDPPSHFSLPNFPAEVSASDSAATRVSWPLFLDGAPRSRSRIRHGRVNRRRWRVNFDCCLYMWDTRLSCGQ